MKLVYVFNFLYSRDDGLLSVQAFSVPWDEAIVVLVSVPTDTKNSSTYTFTTFFFFFFLS